MGSGKVGRGIECVDSHYWIGLPQSGPEPWDTLAAHRPDAAAALSKRTGKTPTECAMSIYSIASAAAAACGSDILSGYQVLPLADRILAGDADGFDEAMRRVLTGSTIGRGNRPNADRIELPETRDDGPLRDAEAAAKAARSRCSPGDAIAAAKYAKLRGAARRRRRDVIAAAGIRDDVLAPVEAAVRTAAWMATASAGVNRLAPLVLSLDAHSVDALRSMDPKYRGSPWTCRRVELWNPEHCVDDAWPEWAVGAKLEAVLFGAIYWRRADVLLVDVADRAYQPGRPSRLLHVVLWTAEDAEPGEPWALVAARRRPDAPRRALPALTGVVERLAESSP